MAVGFDVQSNGKRHVDRSSVTMADELLQQAQELLEGQIDFEGQKQTELISSVLLAVSGLFAFILGFALQNIYVTLWTGLGGAALAFLVVVPPYPFYNKSPERWLPSGSGMAGSGIEIDGKKIN
ncbi:hypothetical protein HO133_000209 [Letharia lupina]|uniref:Signal peptidase complex subunit 1 n=1 Tax=Letharia lupina TaxID=560253 RepID=A0A8H6CH18_9LECA|nr:uncharacterized protein HO133_000209 [Letharia lupina]KAF6223367.1 hypothetical protein HO133_000209 [Letharia lupina]